MFERIGRDLDPAWGVRQLLAVLLVISGLGCAGLVALLDWVGWTLLRLLWELIRMLVALWLAVDLPAFDAMVELEPPPEPVAIAVHLDQPMVWHDAPPPELPELPSLVEDAPGLPPLPGRERERERERERVEELVAVQSVLLLKMIGTTGESGGVADLWGDSPVDAALGQILTAAADTGAAQEELRDEIRAVPAPDEPAPEELTAELAVGALQNAELVGLLGPAEPGVIDTLIFEELEGGLIGGVEGGVEGGVIGEVDRAVLGALVGRGDGEVGGAILAGSGGLGGGGTHAGARVVRQAAPEWPEDGGAVCLVEVRVDARGRARVEAWTACEPALRRAIEAALRQSVFEPASHGGAPVEAPLSLRFERPPG